MFTIKEARQIMEIAKDAKAENMPEIFLLQLVDAAYNRSSEVYIPARDYSDMCKKREFYKGKGYEAYNCTEYPTFNYFVKIIM